VGESTAARGPRPPPTETHLTKTQEPLHLAQRPFSADARGDLPQFALLIGGRLVNGRDAKVENRALHVMLRA